MKNHFSLLLSLQVRRMTSSSFVFQETKLKRSSEGSLTVTVQTDSAEYLPPWARDALDYVDSFRPSVAQLYNSTFVQIVMFVATVYALFIDDLRIVAFPKSADEGLNVFLSIIFFLFIIEIVVVSLYEEDISEASEMFPSNRTPKTCNLARLDRGWLHLGRVPGRVLCPRPPGCRLDHF